jgi:glycosyltransferase involved in cell wall biosynthesis
LLASDIASAREVIDDGRTGMLYAVGDVADLTAKTLHAARDPALRARIGENARAVALTRPLNAMVEAYEAALRGVVASRAVPDRL